MCPELCSNKYPKRVQLLCAFCDISESVNEKISRSDFEIVKDSLPIAQKIYHYGYVLCRKRLLLSWQRYNNLTRQWGENKLTQVHCCVGDFVHTMEPEVGEDNTYYCCCAAGETQSLWDTLCGRTFRVVVYQQRVYKLIQTVTNIINSAQVRKNVL